MRTINVPAATIDILHLTMSRLLLLPLDVCVCAE